MHKYLVFSVPAAAAFVACVLWLLLPATHIGMLMAEGGVVESWTLFAYAAAIVTTCVCLLVATDKVAAGAFLVVLVSLGAREMDLHISLTGTSVLRLSYYLRGEFTGEKAAALATLTLFLTCVGCLWLRRGLSLRRGMRAGEPVAVATAAFCITAIAAKTLDRMVSVLVQDFGLEVPNAAAALVLSVEETMELALPLIVVVAAVQYGRAKWLIIRWSPSPPAPLSSPGDCLPVRSSGTAPPGLPALQAHPDASAGAARKGQARANWAPPAG